LIKQIKAFRPENIKDLDAFLAQHPDAQLLAAEHFATEKRADYILSIGDRKNLQSVQRPAEKPYQIPIVYVVYDAEGSAPAGATAKTQSFSIADNIADINKFLASHDIHRIFVVPVLEATPPLDNYAAGEYGPVPDRRPASMKSHKLVVVYKE